MILDGRLFIILVVTIRFISDQEVILYNKYHEILKVNIISKKSQAVIKEDNGLFSKILTGIITVITPSYEDFSFFSKWAQSRNYFAFVIRNIEIKIFDLELKEVSTLRINARFPKIFYLSNDTFLLINNDNEVYRINGNAPKLEKIVLKDTPKTILSFAKLENEYFFLHVESNLKCQEGRVYDLRGNLISRRPVPNHLR